MAQQNKQSQFQQPSPRTTIISVVLFMLVAFFVGQQFLNMSSAGAKPTDRLITSEFVQAVEQDRATKVVYNAGDYTVSGSYYPAITAGSTGADAFNEAFQALNARMATLKSPETGKALGGVGTTDIKPATLGEPHNFTSTYYGGSLGDLGTGRLQSVVNDRGGYTDATLIGDEPSGGGERHRISAPAHRDQHERI